MSLRILIHKRGASGDVLRTTAVLRAFRDAQIDWVVDAKNAPLIAETNVRIVTTPMALRSAAPYDLVLSLEEDVRDLEEVFGAVTYREIVGTYLDKGRIRYTDSSRGWFDMSLISRHGSQIANRLKRENRRSFQAYLFEMIGARFAGQSYHPFGPPERLWHVWGREKKARILIAPKAGPRWPNKEWAHFDECRRRLSYRWTVSMLEEQPSLVALGREIARHDLVIANDSLPMHIALSQSRAVCALFTCTSPWEIHRYPRMTKVVSPKLTKFFYLSTTDYEARSAIAVSSVVGAVEGLFKLQAEIGVSQVCNAAAEPALSII